MISCFLLQYVHYIYICKDIGQVRSIKYEDGIWGMICTNDRKCLYFWILFILIWWLKYTLYEIIIAQFLLWILWVLFFHCYQVHLYCPLFQSKIKRKRMNNLTTCISKTVIFSQHCWSWLMLEDELYECFRLHLSHKLLWPFDLLFQGFPEDPLHRLRPMRKKKVKCEKGSSFNILPGNLCWNVSCWTRQVTVKPLC